MLEEKLQDLSTKQRLDGDDAFTLLQLLQDHTAPILSLRSVGSSPASRQPTSRLAKTNGLALERRSTCVERSGDGLKGGNRRVVGQRGGKGMNTPELGRVGGEQGGRNSSLGVSSKRTLFGPSLESHSEPRLGSAAAVCARSSSLNFNSLEEFPPMQPAATITTRKKDKKTSKPRRITLTSMQQQHHHSSTHTAHFTPPLLTSDSWSSHPAFVAEATTASVPSPLSEERRLLRKERSKLRKSGGSATKLLSQLDTKCKDMLSIQTSQSGVSGRVQNCSPTDSAVNDSVSPSTTPLDTNIHLSLSQASSSTELKLKEDVTGPGPHTSDSPPQSAGVRVCTSTSLTSTPISGSTGSQYTIHIDRISNQKTLNQLSRLYSKMIIDRLVPNLTSEIHFLVQLLTCTQPAGQGQSVPESEHLFESVENCVFFAVEVLHSIKSILTALDKATLQLLSENVRIKQLEPRLSQFFSEALEAAHTEATSGHRPPSRSALMRVPFQEETDNIKNFPNMRAFHAFKKQRDSFYSILRDWEAHHNAPEWNFQSLLGDKIRLLMNQPPELCSLDHLATLFQKQLLESCGYTAHISAGVSGLEGPLKNLNPDKLMKLSERFLRQSHVSTGTCPPPAFSEAELFFSSFITTADSYIFNHYLSSVLRHELLKLHSRCECVVVKDVPEILHALRVLAKFLGYLDFLPYSSVISPSLLPARTAPPHVTMVVECVREAREKNHLCLTIPWVVDYMSMVDSHALQETQCHRLLCQLMTVYRSALVECRGITTDTFLVLTCLGWLFEIPNIPNSVFFGFLKTDPTPDPAPALNETQTELTTREVLYICCPYLAGIRVILAEFTVGLQSKTSPIRKIKPVSAGTDTPHARVTPSAQLQMKLQDNFFRSHPPNLKQLCDTVSERVAETAIVLVQSKVIPEHTRRGLRVLADWIAKTCSGQSSPDSSVNIEELFHKGEAVRTVAQVSEQTFSSVLTEANEFCKQHSETNTRKAFSSLLCDTISERVMAVAVGISTHWSVEHCMKWIHSKLRGVVLQEVRGGFERLKKAVRAGSKANQSHHSAPSLDVSSSVNSTPHHPHTHLLSLSGGLTPQSSIQPSQLENTLSRFSVQRLQSETSYGPTSQSGTELVTSTIRGREKCPSTDEVQRIGAVTAGVKGFIASQVAVVDGGNSPHLLHVPCGVDNLLKSSVQLAALLVSHGLMSGSCECSNENPPLVTNIVSLWSLLKGLKQEIPIHILLNAEFVTHYLQQEEKDVWNSLTCLLIESIKLSVVTTDIVEALWMCRIKQSPSHQKKAVVSGGAIFLATWYGQNEGKQECWNIPGVFREACFVRLLSVVDKESDCPSIAGLRNHPSLPLLSL